MKIYLEDVFKTSGTPTYTFVKPQEYTKLIVSLRTKGRGLIIEGPSGIGKTTEIFKELYFKRWGIETLYDKLKNKLKVEEFTGYSEISIMQDFYCTLFLSNIQSLLVSEANDELRKQNIKDKKYEYKVNTNLSIGFIKTRIVDLFTKGSDTESTLQELESLFLKTLIPIRPNRSNPRNTDKFRARKKPTITKNFKASW